MRIFGAVLILVLILSGAGYLITLLVRNAGVESGLRDGRIVPHNAQKLSKQEYIAYLKRTGRWDDLELQRRIKAVEDTKPWF